MTHPSHDALWTWAQYGDEAPGPVGSHVESCPECAQVVADIRVAQQVMNSLPPAPPMPEELARRVGEALAEKADRQFLNHWRRWWAGLLNPRLVLLTAVALLAVLGLRQLRLADDALVSPVAVTPPAPALVTDAPKVAAATPAPPPPVTPPKKRVTASVSMAKKARTDERPAAKTQVLEEGAVVATESGGSLWMRLQDGTRAGLTGATKVTLTRMEETSLRLDVAQGSLAMTVPHRADRVVTVQAGDVEVKDLGTRFLVSRTEGRVLVAVEEGAVEVKTPTTSRTVGAGHAASWHDGRLDTLAWEVTPSRPPGITTAPQPSSVARLDDEDDEEEVSEEPERPDASVPEPPPTPDDEWAKLPPTARGAPPPARVPEATRPAKPGVRFKLGVLEERLRELHRSLLAPFMPSERAREERMREVASRADRGDCRGALAVAERWLRQPSTRRAEEPTWRRAVLTQKWRCLLAQGRADEASVVRRELDAYW